MTFTQAVKSGFRNYTNGQGRAVRSEYWYWQLFVVLVSIAVQILEFILSAAFGLPERHPLFVGMDLAVRFAFFLPNISVTIRRLHDTGRSGWWMFIALTVIGVIPLVIWLCMRGKPGKNQYGRNPLEPNVEEVF